MQPESPDLSLINDDIRPAKAEERHWSVLNMASLWVGMVVCVPAYMLAGGLVQQGMNWMQAVGTIALGNIIVLIPMVLNGHPGTQYGIPFPVLARASFGIRGAHLPSLLRAVVAAGWFGIQTWVGGAAIYQLFNVLVGGALTSSALPVFGINIAELICFLLFWAIQVFIIYRGIDSIRVLETYAAPFLIVMGLVLLGWAWRAGGGFGEMLSSPGQFVAGGAREGEFWKVFVPSVTGMVGFWATLSLNIPDFTRYAKSQRDQIVGQAIGLPTTMTLFAFIGVAVTSATPVIFATTLPDGSLQLADPVWDPVVLLARIGGGFSVVLSLFALAVATLSTNLAANVVSPANALVNANPRKITFQMGGYITAAIGVVMFPWKLMADPSGYIFTWLIGYSALLGPIGGILVADYYFLRRTRLDLNDLYRVNGRYSYINGFNPLAIIAFVVAVVPNIPGFLHQINVLQAVPAIFDSIYTYAWFAGFILAAVLYSVLMKMMDKTSTLEI